MYIYIYTYIYILLYIWVVVPERLAFHSIRYRYQKETA